MNRNLILSLSIFLAFPIYAHAQQDGSMRAMAIDQLAEYGQAVYDRGDYAQAAQVYSRILAMDPQNREALEIAKSLNKKGVSVEIPAQAVQQTIKIQAEVKPKEAAPAPVAVAEQAPQAVPAEPAVPAPSTEDNQDLKQSIQKVNDTIEKLKDEVAELHEQVEEGQQVTPVEAESE